MEQSERNMKDSIDEGYLQFKNIEDNDANDDEFGYGSGMPSPFKNPTMVETQFQENPKMSKMKKSNQLSPRNYGYSNLQKAAFSNAINFLIFFRIHSEQMETLLAISLI